MRTAIRDAWILTQNPSRDVLRGDVIIEDERIVSVGPTGMEADREIDARGDILMPGLVNTHNHAAMSVMKGCVDDLSFPDFLNKVFRVDSDRCESDIDLGTRLSCLEMIRSGTTTFVDLYYDEHVIAKAVQDAGIRGVLCWCVLDEQFTTQKGKPIDNCRRFCQQYRDQRKIVPGVGLQGVYVCGEETCREAAEYAREEDLLLHFHLSETRGEVHEHKKKTGKRPAEWLDSIGVLGPNALSAHSAWLTINEVRLMAKSGMSIATCPSSNMKLATGGVAPIPEMLLYGVNVSIGTDGSTTNNSLDMFAEMKTLGLLQKSSRWDPTIAKAQQLLDFSTINGAKVIGMADRIGSIEPGKYADLIILDGKAPNLRPLLPENLVSNLAYSSNGLNVKTVLCQGDLVMQDWKIMTLDEESVLQASEEHWKKLCLR